MKYITLGLLCLCWLPLHAASSFNCLPDSTAASFHIPNGMAAHQSMEKTRFYSVFGDPARIEKIKAFINKQNPGGLDMAEAAFQNFGLSMADLPKICHGETGLAVALHKPGPEAFGTEPAFTVFVYIEPDAELGDRLMAALDQAMGQGDGQNVRNDYQLGDHDVIEIVNQREDSIALINRHGDKILAAICDKRSHEQSKIAFALFLDAHTAGGDDNGYASILMSTPGLADGQPAGVNVMQLSANPQVLIELLPEEDMATPNLPGAEVKAALGLEKFKPAILQINFENNIMHQFGFMGLEAPLAGLAKMCALPEIDAAPAAWVNGSLPSYSHAAIDLQELYKTITETALAIAGPMAQMQINQINQAPLAFVGTDLETFLGNFGKRIVVLDLGSKRPEGADNAMSGSFSNRLAIVWDMNDTTALKQAMPLLQQQAAMMGGMAANEQGATGIRFNMTMMQPGLEAGVFVTDGQLVIALGAGVTEQILSSLAQPPAAADSFAQSATQQAAAALLPARNGFLYAAQDTDRLLMATMDVFHKELEPQVLMNPDLAVIKEVLPTAEEIKGMFGVGTSHAWRTENGLQFKAAIEVGLAE